MSSLKRNFAALISSLVLLMLALFVLSVVLANSADAAESQDFPVPVSVNALMVTMIDHSAHYIWDYAALEDMMLEEEWLAVEYYSIQLAAAGPLMTLGGTGEFDNAWAISPQWLSYSMDMSNAAMKALNAARLQDKFLLETAGDELLDACLACHRAFKPEIPSEGVIHDPLYDQLYHLFQREGAL
ncbi:MAG: hypothetical protein COA71_01665 [SAR86 cluster bacterium]|uniref:Cytochrome c domain-containing protein n=1 Tax=SAR86 cluster bacterium TaxID=2030880 RepID=A0A2A5CI99_9GAMM|nr:MAG: hypothetical protein COA71_01665 [SAR86 cluster bacterium]